MRAPTGALPSQRPLAPLAALAASAVLGAASVVVAVRELHERVAPTLVVQALATLLVLGGVSAWLARRRVAIARQVVLLGALLFVPPLRASTSTLVFAPGFCLAYLWTVPPASLALSWPDGRLRNRFDRLLVAVSLALSVATQTGRYLVERPQPGWLTLPTQPQTPWSAAGSAAALVLTAVIGLRVVVRLLRPSPAGPLLTRSSDVVAVSVLVVALCAVVVTAANLAGVSDPQIQVLIPVVSLLAVPQSLWLYRRLERQLTDDAAAAAGERQRIHADLHDETQGLLVAAQYAIELARNAPPSERDALLEKAHEAVTGAVDTVRTVTRGIYPPALQQSGLTAALRTLAARTPVPVVLDVPDRRWRRRVEYNAYFAVSELITNALKHAEPTRIDVRLRDDDGLRITVQDDGHGGALDPDAGDLRQLRQRLATVDGRLEEVVSTPDAGTRLTIYIPEA